MTHFDEYEKYDATGLADLIRRREVSANDVLEAAIERVEALNPAINAVIRPMYEEAERTVKAGLPEGPFTGVPFLLKDLGVYCAGVPTTSGSALFADFVPAHDSNIVTRYKAAGLVIMGKTNTPEFGICHSTEPQFHGPTCNPWDRKYSPGGSSGGSAAAVAARMLPMAHATDGGGSIRIPAANCGLFGFKPTRALNPYGPDLGEGLAGLATSHCVSLSVRDSARLLDATCGPELGAPYVAPMPKRAFADEVGVDPGRLRIALMTTTLSGAPVDPECVKAAEDAAALCESLGHAVEHARPDLDELAVRRAWRVIPAANLWNIVTQRSQALGREPSQEGIERITWLWARDGRRYTAADYQATVQGVHRVGRDLALFFRGYDVLLSPTMAHPPLRLGVIDMMGEDLEDYIEHQLLDEIPFTPLFNESGGPAMSVPLYWADEGLPVGVQFGATYGNDALLFRLAAQLEAARPWADRRPKI